MKLNDNLAIAAAVENLRTTIRREVSAGRAACSMWSLFATTDDGVTIIGGGCNCEVCTKVIALSAKRHHEESLGQAVHEWVN